MGIAAALTLSLAWLAAPAGFTPAPPAEAASQPAAPATAPGAAPVFAPAPPATTPTPTPIRDEGMGGAPAEESPPVPPVAPPPPPPSLPPPVPEPPPPWHLRRYGDAGSMELALALGYTQQSGIVGGGGVRRFILDGIGPGLEVSIQKADGRLTTGLVLASLKLVPLRGDAGALVITGRGGRVFLSDHEDGWGAGVGAGAIVFLSPGVGLEVGYAILWLLPRRFCADLLSCSIAGPELGLRVAF